MSDSTEPQGILCAKCGHSGQARTHGANGQTRIECISCSYWTPFYAFLPDAWAEWARAQAAGPAEPAPSEQESEDRGVEWTDPAGPGGRCLCGGRVGIVCHQHHADWRYGCQRCFLRGTWEASKERACITWEVVQTAVREGMPAHVFSPHEGEQRKQDPERAGCPACGVEVQNVEMNAECDKRRVVCTVCGNIGPWEDYETHEGREVNRPQAPAGYLSAKDFEFNQTAVDDPPGGAGWFMVSSAPVAVTGNLPHHHPGVEVWATWARPRVEPKA